LQALERGGGGRARARGRREQARAERGHEGRLRHRVARGHRREDVGRSGAEGRDELGFEAGGDREIVEQEREAAVRRVALARAQDGGAQDDGAIGEEVARELGLVFFVNYGQIGGKFRELGGGEAGGARLAEGARDGAGEAGAAVHVAEAAELALVVEGGHDARAEGLEGERAGGGELARGEARGGDLRGDAGEGDAVVAEEGAALAREEAVEIRERVEGAADGEALRPALAGPEVRERPVLAFSGTRRAEDGGYAHAPYHRTRRVEDQHRTERKRPTAASGGSPRARRRCAGSWSAIVRSCPPRV
jgi:hypothetical protein